MKVGQHQQNSFARTAKAVRYLVDHQLEQPQLAQIARHVGVTPEVVQREFRRLTGISPKRFLQQLTSDFAAGLLDQGLDVLRTSIEVGLSSPGRLHDHMVRIEAMTPGEWKSRLAGSTMEWGLGRCAWGMLAMAWTRRGIHRLEFLNDAHDPTSFVAAISMRAQNGYVERNDKNAQDRLDRIFADCRGSIDLCVVATPFQAAVLKGLLAIDDISTYRELAAYIGMPRAARAVGQAVGANPVAVLIPCHRVLRASGAIGGYHWGSGRKLALLAASGRED